MSNLHHLKKLVGESESLRKGDIKSSIGKKHDMAKKMVKSEGSPMSFYKQKGRRGTGEIHIGAFKESPVVKAGLNK